MVAWWWLLFKAITSGSVSWLCHAKYPLPLAQHQHNTTHPSMQNLFQFLKTCSFSNFHVRHCPFLHLLPHIPHSIVSFVAEATRSCCGGRGDGGGWHQGRVGWVETVHNRILWQQCLPSPPLNSFTIGGSVKQQEHRKKQYFERCQNGFEAIIDKSFLVSIQPDLCENRLKFGRSSRQVHNNLPTKWFVHSVYCIYI